MKLGHPDYPLLLPTLVAVANGFPAADMLFFNRLLGLVCALAMGAAVFLTLRREGDLCLAASATVLVMSTPALHRWTFSQTADVPLCYLVTLVFAGLLARLEGPSWSPFLLGFVAGLLPWTKNEGIPLLVGFLAGLAVSMIKSRDTESLSWIVAGATPGTLATLAFKAVWPARQQLSIFFGSGWVSRVFDVERLGTILKRSAQVIVHPGDTPIWGLSGLILIVLLGAVVVVPRLRSNLLRLGGGSAVVFLSLSALAYLLAYLTTRHSLEWHLLTLRRVPLHLLPALAIALFYTLSSACSRHRRA
jgi:hypothetical protein